MKHLANLKDLSGDDIREILDLSATIKANPGDYAEALQGQSLAMLFQKTSTRTRVSFEVAMTQLGGHGLYIDWTSSNFVLSGIGYETEYLSRNVDCIMARLLHHRDLLEIVATSQVPVINGCCEKFHPCQALTDVLTMREHSEEPLEGRTLVYAGVQNNVSNSLTLICHKLGIHLILATPPPADNGESRDADVDAIIATSPHVQHTTSLREAVREADFVYTDTWIDMQYFNDPHYADEKAATLDRMLPFQLNPALLQGLTCRVMHDMPIHEGFEITADLVRDPRSIIFTQAANRLHSEKGLLVWMLGNADA